MLMPLINGVCPVNNECHPYTVGKPRDETVYQVVPFAASLAILGIIWLLNGYPTLWGIVLCGSVSKIGFGENDSIITKITFGGLT